MIDDDNGDDDDDDDDDDTLVIVSHHNRCHPYLFYVRFKGSVRPGWRCRGCVVMIVIMTVGDAEDAQ